MPNSTPVVGIDLGGTNIQVGVVAHDVERVGASAGILGRAKKKTKGDQGAAAVIERIAEATESACAEAGIRVSDLGAVGIGAPGAIDHATHTVIEAVNLRWSNVPLGKMLSERLGLPVSVDNDVNVAVLGECRLGAGLGARNLLGVWVGTGVGGALILNGKLHYGAYGSAGEIGHMHALPFNPPGGRSLEQNCSRAAIADRLARLIRANRDSILPELVEGRLDRIRSSAIAEAYQRRDELTREVIDHSADLLGVFIGGIITLLSIERVVLGGGLVEALGDPYVKAVTSAAHNVIFPDRAKAASIVESKLSDDAGLLGAALLGLRTLTPKGAQPTVG